MTWYTVEHACGDTERHQITGSTAAERDWRAAALRETECSACQQRQREAEHARRNAAAAAAAADQGLPALTGTDRQVPWATTIRADALALLDEMLAYIDNEGPTAAAGQRADDQRRVIESYRRIYLAATQAKAWIDYRAWALRPGELARRLVTEDEHKRELAALGSHAYTLRRLATRVVSRRNARGAGPT